MRKFRLNKKIERVLAVFICICMIIPMFAGVVFFDIFKNVSVAKAETTGESDEYKNETLEYVWQNGGVGGSEKTSYWNASRPYYACSGSGASFDSFGGVSKRTIFHVFAFEGDTICIGSSVNNSGLDINHKLKSGLSVCTFQVKDGKVVSNNYESFDEAHHYADEGSVDVVMTDPYGNVSPIDIRNTETDKTGYIASPYAEYAAILMQADGSSFKGTYTYSAGGKEVTAEYIPYTYKVQETGVYTFEFHSYDKTGGDTPNDKSKRSDQWPTAEHNYINKSGDNDTDYQDSGNYIAAINLTVFDENGIKQPGRTYADFLSLQMDPANDGVRDAYYILTTDSYIYKMQFNGAKPYTYNFFSNNKGIYDSATGEIIYTSVKDIDNSNSFARMGAAYKYPGTKDTDMLKSYYIFLEYPDSKLEGHLFEKAVQPDPASNIRFVSEIEEDDGEMVPGAFEGEGGYFAFDVEEATTATLRLEFTGSGFAGKDYAPVEISGAVNPHSTNFFYWDGKDGNGKVIESGNYDIRDFAFTVTTKAGEIHFPILDMENAKNGITFTRLSHIYDKSGKQLDGDSANPNIYDYTKNVIYYDETAIYYGEEAASTGYSEKDVDVAKAFFSEAGNEGKYWSYNNVTDGGGEFAARQSSYIGETTGEIGKNSKVRVGDHSHTTNVIKFFSDEGELIKTPDGNQKNMIDYLSSDTAHYPAGKSSGTGKGTVTSSGSYGSSERNGSTTDYAIANYWTFIPAKPATTSSMVDNIKIADPKENQFSLTGRVFYDSQSAGEKGKFDAMSTADDYLMDGVTLNLYKKTDASETYNDEYTYVSYEAGKVTKLDKAAFETTRAEKYRLVGSGQTPGEGMYKFTGLEYDPGAGTDYLYEVIKPSDSYTATSGSTKAAALKSGTSYYGYYADKSYNDSYSGTEIQKITVGGSGVDPTKLGRDKSTANDSHTVCAVDVGYTYALMDKSLSVKKDWENNGSSVWPNAVVYEISYDLENDALSYIYDYWTLSAINAWQHEDSYLPAKQKNKNVTNYYVSAEYYIYFDPSGEKKIYKHTYSRSNDDYGSFVGDAHCVELSDVFEAAGVGMPADACNISDLPDMNGDGKRDGWDMSAIDAYLKDKGKDGWKDIDEKAAKYRAVLDRNVAASSTDITITNSAAHGTIEIFKYHDSPEPENALQGATFRVYKGTIDQVKAMTSEQLAEAQVGSGLTTRSNGRVAFPNLDPNETYTVKEMYAPDGYRILEQYYQVVPSGKKASVDEELQKLTVEFKNELAELEIGNALADTTFMIRKQISGRSWQNDDEFCFTITPLFGDLSSLDSSGSFVIDDTDKSLHTTGSSPITEEEILNSIKQFAEEISKSSSSRVVINYDSPYYSYTSRRPGASGSYTITSSTEKVSDDGLLVAGGKDEDTSGATTYITPAFCGVSFKYAGTYTFTVKEDLPISAGGADGTLTYSTREYTVTVLVKRLLNEGEGAINLENSHLEAEILDIVYKETPESEPVTFAGSSPVFTNTYAPAPAVQTTSYNIQKNFTGRESGWLETDEFTVKIDGYGADTQEAIKTDKLRIYGFEKASASTTDVSKNTEETGWVYTFTYDNHGTGLPFTAFIFDNITFDVKYVNATTGEEWDPSEHDGAESPSESDITKGVWTAQTIPVEYWLDIYEDIPDEAKKSSVLSYNGITYDGSHYFLHITLRNAESKVSSTEEEDGIIDEIDMQLFKAESFGEIDMSKPVATCKTVQEVLDETEWKDRSKKPSSGAYSWWYVDSTGGIRRDESGGSVIPAGHKQLIRKTEVHADGSDHTMTITNTYDAIYTWTPKLTKILTGRNWAANDEFVFEIECTEWPGSDSEAAADACVDMPSDKEVVIKSGTAGHTESFEDIKFKKTGTYVFTVTEKNHTGGTSIAPDKDIYSYSVTVVIKDDNKGHLTATFNGYDLTAGIVFTNVYSDTAKSFEIGVQKTLVGRDWKEDDEFSFKIAPDGDTAKAIDEGLLTMPAEFGDPSSDGSYTVKVGYESSTSVESVLEKIFGEVTVVKLPADKDNVQYKFTVSEITDGLKAKNMKLRSEKEIVLTVNAARKLEDGVPTGILDVTATFAYMSGGTSGGGGFERDSSDPKAVIPFVNVCFGQLTVEKEVVSSIDDTTEFNFIAEFEFDDDIPDDERTITVRKNGEAAETFEPSSTDGSKSTFSFTLKHGDEVVFTDVAPYTSYTVTETDSKKEDYVLLRATNAKGENLTLGGAEKNQVAGKINGDSAEHAVRFVNGKIHRLPAAGGTGLGRLILLGIMLVAASGICLVLRGMARRKAVVSPKKANSRYK